jgi:hypothetical protein
VPAATGADWAPQPGDDGWRFHEMGSTVGTPRCRSVTRSPAPCTQSAEFQTRWEPDRMISAMWLAPTLNEQVCGPVATTSTVNCGSWWRP